MFWAAIGQCTSHRGSNRTSVSSSVNRLSRVILSPSCKPSIPTVKPGVEVLQHEANSGTLTIHPNYSSNTRPTFAFYKRRSFPFLRRSTHSLWHCFIFPGVSEALWQHVEALRLDLKALVEMRALTLLVLTLSALTPLVLIPLALTELTLLALTVLPLLALTLSALTLLALTPLALTWLALA